VDFFDFTAGPSAALQQWRWWRTAYPFPAPAVAVEVVVEVAAVAA